MRYESEPAEELKDEVGTCVGSFLNAGSPLRLSWVAQRAWNIPNEFVV